MTIDLNRRGRNMNRRRFLGWAGAGAGALALGASGFSESKALAQPSFRGNPFSLGVASGDPAADGFVLWTRLAPDPLEPGGGMPSRKVPVRYEIATDEGFRRVIEKGNTFATPELAHSVHVEAEGLLPGRQYFYRFKTGAEISPVGRTKTAPPAGASVQELRLAFVSCQNYPAGYYTAYGHLADEALDIVVHLGDYIYEGDGAGKIGRAHRPATEIFSLDDYRIRYGQYKGDEQLQAAHAAHPWAVVFDDHEVDNNFADEDAQEERELEQSREEFLRRRARAFQAYYEHQPLRSSAIPSGPDIQIYRSLGYGTLAQLNLLDTRQYRSNQACGDGRSEPGQRPPCPERAAPERSITGDEQERWLVESLAGSGARWNVLAQQVFFAQRDFDFGDGERYSMDAWDGYLASRNRVIDAFRARSVRNPIVLTGDVHASWAANLLADFDDPDSEVVGTEFVGTSISSGGNGSDQNTDTPRIADENPHIKFYNDLRGYVRCNITPQQWRTDYRVVPYVTEPGAPVSTRATFLVEDGNPGAQQASAQRVPGATQVSTESTAREPEAEIGAVPGEGREGRGGPRR